MAFIVQCYPEISSLVLMAGYSRVLASPRDDEITDAVALWRAVLRSLRKQVTQSVYDCCLKETCALSFTENTLTIGVRTPYAKEWLEHRLAGQIKRTLKNLLKRPVRMRVVLVNDEDAEDKESN